MLFVSNQRDSRYVRVVYGPYSHFGERYAKVSSKALIEAKSILGREDEFTSAHKALRQHACKRPGRFFLFSHITPGSPPT